ncbi:MAG: hypothetical protein V3S55_10090 [Nitrospiraceae bacterium]
MRPSSAKAKGRRLQDEVRQMLLETFTELEEDDVKCAIMGEGGEDIHLSPTARKLFPFSVECKNQERIQIWAALEQAESHGHAPLLVFKRNRSRTYATLRVEDLMTIMARYDR